MSNTNNTLDAIEKIMGLTSSGIDLGAKAIGSTSDVTGKIITTHKYNIMIIFGIIAAMCFILMCISFCLSSMIGGGMYIISPNKDKTE